MNKCCLMIVLGLSAAGAYHVYAAGDGHDYDGYRLVWSDEFDGKELDSSNWSYDHGFMFNDEDQYYTENNFILRDGKLIIEARIEEQDNPDYRPKSKDRRYNNPRMKYTSGRIHSQGKREFQYGRFECRAKVPTASGSWPAFWTMGRDWNWPSCGEIDIMEFTNRGNNPSVWANVIWGEPGDGLLFRHRQVSTDEFKTANPGWDDDFHVWRMDWDEDYIRLYIDDILMRETPLDMTYNSLDADAENPMRQPHYIILNLAIGGTGGGDIDDSRFPLQYEIDYVRVYQR